MTPLAVDRTMMMILMMGATLRACGRVSRSVALMIMR